MGDSWCYTWVYTSIWYNHHIFRYIIIITYIWSKPKWHREIDNAEENFANRELKQQWLRRLRKRQLNGVFALLQVILYRAISISFISSNVGEFLGSWILMGCIKVLEKEKTVVVLCLRQLIRKASSSFVFSLKVLFWQLCQKVKTFRFLVWIIS